MAGLRKLIRRVRNGFYQSGGYLAKYIQGSMLFRKQGEEAVRDDFSICRMRGYPGRGKSFTKLLADKIIFNSREGKGLFMILSANDFVEFPISSCLRDNI
jgi:hypothetical protein